MAKIRKQISWIAFTALLFLTLSVIFESNAFMFVLYTAICVVFNGRFIYEKFLKDKAGIKGNFAAYFFTGYFILIVLYYISCLFRTFMVIKIATAVLTVCSFADLYKNFSVINIKSIKNFVYYNTEKIICIFVLMLWSAYIMYSTFTTPSMMWNPDYQWHMGNMYTLSSGFDFRDIRVDGMVFKYHYFSDLFFAIGRILFGLIPYNCAVRYSILIVPFLAIECMSLLFSNMESSVKLIPFMAAFSLVLMPLSGSRNDLTYQLLSNINSVGIGLPCGVLCAAVIMKYTKQLKVTKWNTVYSMILICLTTGFKGPFSLSLLGGATGYTLYMMIKRIKLPENWFVYIAGLYASFGITYFSLLSGALNEDYMTESMLIESVYKIPQLIPYIDKLGLGLKARFLFFLPLSFLFLTGTLAIPFIIICMKYVIKFLNPKDKETSTDVFVICLCVSSVAAYYMFNLAGTSQNYFLYFSTPFIGYLGFKELAFWEEKIKIKGIVALASAVILSISAVYSFKKADTGDVIDFYTPEIIAGADWIKENVPENEKMAVNRHGAFYMLSGLTGRRFNVEGIAYARNSGVTAEQLSDEVAENDLLFNREYEERKQLAERLGVDWMVYILETWEGETETEFTEQMLDFGQGFDIRFKNEDIRIIQIKK